MSNVQVRDVPDAVLRALKQRAAAQGLSLQRFLQEVLLAEAAVATNAANPPLSGTAVVTANGVPASSIT